MADVGGEVSITQLSDLSGLPQPTIYRLLRTLVAENYVRQGRSRRYSLGPRLIRLGESAGMALGSVAKPYLIRLVEATHENANLTLLDGDEVVYIAQAPSLHTVRMFIEVGRRVHAHCTAAGKALLAELPDDEVQGIVSRTGLPARTTMTITETDRLLKALGEIRQRGYAVDEGEQEVGVRCFAVPVAGAPARLALSVSGPSARMDDGALERAIPVMKQVARDLAIAMRSTADGSQSE